MIECKCGEPLRKNQKLKKYKNEIVLQCLHCDTIEHQAENRYDMYWLSKVDSVYTNESQNVISETYHYSIIFCPHSCTFKLVDNFFGSVEYESKSYNDCLKYQRGWCD